MILLLNGAFGVGKTTIAARLVCDRPNTRILDPEAIGFVLRRIPGLASRDDYQHLALWRTLTVYAAWGMRRALGYDLVVPMTLAHREYFDELRTRIARFEPDLRHVCLTATSDTLHARLRARGDADGAWPHAQVDRCVSALAEPEYDTHVDTEGRSPVSIAAEIHDLLGAEVP